MPLLSGAKDLAAAQLLGFLAQTSSPILRRSLAMALVYQMVLPSIGGGFEIGEAVPVDKPWFQIDMPEQRHAEAAQLFLRILPDFERALNARTTDRGIAKDKFELSLAHRPHGPGTTIYGYYESNISAGGPHDWRVFHYAPFHRERIRGVLPDASSLESFLDIMDEAFLAGVQAFADMAQERFGQEAARELLETISPLDPEASQTVLRLIMYEPSEPFLFDEHVDPSPFSLAMGESDEGLFIANEQATRDRNKAICFAGSSLLNWLKDEDAVAPRDHMLGFEAPIHYSSLIEGAIPFSQRFPRYAFVMFFETAKGASFLRADGSIGAVFENKD